MIEVGNRSIKERRRSTSVKIAPGGVVADYVPWYFATRSPMMFAIDRGNVPEYHGGCGPLVYLVSTVEDLQRHGCRLVFTDRNAVHDYAAHGADVDAVEIDWSLMRAKMWNNTSNEPDRMERRMAECLAHRSVPWEAIQLVATKSEPIAARVRNAIDAADHQPDVRVQPDWYF